MLSQAQADEGRATATGLRDDRLGQIARVLQLENGDDALFSAHYLGACQGNHRGGIQIWHAPGLLVVWWRLHHAEDGQVNAIAPGRPAGPAQHLLGPVRPVERNQ